MLSKHEEKTEKNTYYTRLEYQIFLFKKKFKGENAEVITLHSGWSLKGTPAINIQSTRINMFIKHKSCISFQLRNVRNFKQIDKLEKKL